VIPPGHPTTVTATNGISVDQAHSLITRYPTIAGFVSPRATQSSLRRARQRPRRRATSTSAREIVRSTATTYPMQRPARPQILRAYHDQKKLDDAHHHAPSKSRTSEARLGECVPRRATRRMAGASTYVADLASSGRRFGNQTADHGRRATSFRDLQRKGFEDRLAHADCLKGRTETDRKVSEGGTSCVEARDWAPLSARDPMVGGSQDPLLLWRRITTAYRGAALRAAGHRGRGSRSRRRAVNTPSPP
jgi:hypothetical protein